MPECHHPWKLLGLVVSVCSSGLWCSLRQHVFRPRLTDPYVILGGVLTIILVRLGYSFIATNLVAGGVESAHVTPGELLRNVGRAGAICWYCSANCYRLAEHSRYCV